MLCASCAGKSSPASTPSRVPARPATAAERILPLLPDGAQVVIELDLARLRANAVVGEVATRALERLGGETHVPGLPFTVHGSPLASADAVVIASYGVGTAQATSVTVLATHVEVPGAVQLSPQRGSGPAPELVALGPEDLTGQLATRAAIDAKTPVAASAQLMALRAHAMPRGATGAILRVTARLPFDARIALARQMGLEVAPAQLSLWADIADDLAVVIDTDADDPGDRPGPENRAGKGAARRLAGALRTALAAIADDPTIRALGVPNSLADAHVVTQGTWVRAIIAVGPRHLARAVERANAILVQGSAS
jgi:hypothetical protein